MTEDPIPLWPGPAPGSETWTHSETTERDERSGAVVYKNVVVPTLTPVLPPEDRRNRTAMIIAPGGAFVALAWEHEAIPTAEWFPARARGRHGFGLTEQGIPIDGWIDRLSDWMTHRGLLERNA